MPQEETALLDRHLEQIYIMQRPFACIQSISGEFFIFIFFSMVVRLFTYALPACKLRTQAQDKPISYTDTQLRLSLVAHCTECAWQAGWWKVTAGKELIIDYDSNGKASLEFYFKNTSIRFPPETVFIYQNDPIVGEFNLKIIWQEQMTFIRFHSPTSWIK